MRLSHLTLPFILFAGQVTAEGIKIIGTVDTALKTSTSKSHVTSSKSIQHIKLMKVELSELMQKNIEHKLKSSFNSKKYSVKVGTPSQIQLGMNNVPVLNQGPYGTCTTFSITAVIDAALNKGNYVSQLCLLQLGNYIENNGHVSSGWDGAGIADVLSKIALFGVVSKEQQELQGCGGITEYPNKGYTYSTEMTPNEYHQMSISVNKKIEWTPVVDSYSRKEQSSYTIIQNVKKALRDKDRLAFGVLLLDINLGNVGALGKNREENDTWVVTSKIEQDTSDFFEGKNPEFQLGGHAMIITGYDDNAIAIDNEGSAHKGLFTLRNSWGELAGDQGNFYMSYEYFAVVAMEAQRATKLNMSFP